MKQRIFKQKWLFLVLAVLLLIPAGFTLAKYAETRNVGTVTLDIQANSNSPTVLAGNFLNDDLSWQYQLGFYPTALVFDSYDNHAATLGMNWGQGKNVGEADEDGNFTDGVKLFKKDTTAYILAKGSNSVTFPNNSTYLLASPDSSDNIMQDVTSITFGSIDTSNTKIMMSMFYECSALKELDLSKFKTANVTSMQNMFHGCKALETLDLSSFNTENLKNIKAMFQNCTALKTLNISSFNTEKVTNMSYMFNGCSNLEQLDLSGFNTQSVTNMSYMFDGCSNLKQLDLSSFNTQSVTNMDRMFIRCSKLEEVTLGTNFKFFGTNGYLPEQTDSNIPGANGLWYTDQASYYTPEQAAEHQKTVGEATTYYAVGVKAPDAPAKVLAPSWKNQLGNSTPTALVMDSYDNQAHIIEELNKDWETGGQNVGEQEDCVKLFMDTNSNTAYVLAKGSCPVTFPENSSNLFMGRSSLKTIQFNRINTSQVTNMAAMFLGSTKLTSLDLTGFDTRKVIDMHWMFNGCIKLTSLNVTSFDTRKVTNMVFMFFSCSELTALDLSSFNTQKVTDMYNMFTKCSKLEQVTLGKDFKFFGTDGYLPAQTESNIPGADKKWYYWDSSTSAVVGKTNAEVAAYYDGTATTTTTYYAVASKAPQH